MTVKFMKLLIFASLLAAVVARRGGAAPTSAVSVGSYSYARNRAGNDDELEENALDTAIELTDVGEELSTQSECSAACVVAEEKDMDECCACEKQADKFWYGKNDNNCKPITSLNKSHALAFVQAINQAWNSTHGLAGCLEKLSDKDRDAVGVNFDKLHEVKAKYEKKHGQWSTEAYVSTGYDTKDRYKDIGIPFVKDLLPFPDHVVQHRSGLKVIHSMNGPLYLCSSWTSVCNMIPPHKGQMCETASLVVGCGTDEVEIGDCLALPGPKRRLSMPNFV